MTVGELIMELRQYDTDADVFVEDGDYACGVRGVEIGTVTKFRGEDDENAVVIRSGSQAGAVDFYG